MNSPALENATPLEGAALDLAVVRAEGYRFNGYDDPYDGCDLKDEVVEDHRRFRPSTEWKHGGPIIEREKIRLDYSDNLKLWAARMDNTTTTVSALGDTALIAAMRCYVMSKAPR